jgi:hypothetical protein
MRSCFIGIIFTKSSTHDGQPEKNYDVAFCLQAGCGVFAH